MPRCTVAARLRVRRRRTYTVRYRTRLVTPHAVYDVSSGVGRAVEHDGSARHVAGTRDTEHACDCAHEQNDVERREGASVCVCVMCVFVMCDYLPCVRCHHRAAAWRLVVGPRTTTTPCVRARRWRVGSAARWAAMRAEQVRVLFAC
jgi:hypothetical protein